MPLYTHSTDNCQSLIKKLNLAGIAASEDSMHAVGSTIATHIGPGAYGLVFVEAE